MQSSKKRGVYLEINLIWGLDSRLLTGPVFGVDFLAPSGERENMFNFLCFNFNLFSSWTYTNITKHAHVNEKRQTHFDCCFKKDARSDLSLNRVLTEDLRQSE